MVNIHLLDEVFNCKSRIILQQIVIFCPVEQLFMQYNDIITPNVELLTRNRRKTK